MTDSFDINALLSQALDMQQQMAEAQARTAETEIIGRAGGGAVQITVTGGMQFLNVEISPTAVDPDDVSLLEDLVLAALNDAFDQLEELQRTAMPALDLGGLGGMGGSDSGLGGMGGSDSGLGGMGGSDSGLGGMGGSDAFGGFGGALPGRVIDTTTDDGSSDS